MPEIKLKVGDLALDHDNPRISHAAGQQEALQKIVSDQKVKLVKLAQSIADHGLNPMDRFLVLRLNQTPKKYIALEGNRRVAVFKLLTNPAVMSGLDMPPPMKRIFERLAKTFKKSKIEPLACFELHSREEGRYWLSLRHNVGHDGAGIDNWKTMAKRRFDGKPPVVQALELVTERAGLLSSVERAAITDKFPTSTFERFLENRAVRQELGIDVKDGKLISKLSGSEIAKPLSKIVADLATKRKQVGDFMKTQDMLDYIREDFGKSHLPDLTKTRKQDRSLDEIPLSEFSKARPSVTRRKPDPSDRQEVVPKSCRLQITDNRIAEIYKELRNLKLENGPAAAPNAIAVLLRVFLEMSVDHFLENNGGQLKAIDNGRERWKKLDTKLTEVIGMLLSMGVKESQLAAVKRSVSVQTSPTNVDLFHLYVHERFATPSPAELKAAWNNAQPLFEKIWP
jgi:hypothetical protein